MFRQLDQAPIRQMQGRLADDRARREIGGRVHGARLPRHDDHELRGAFGRGDRRRPPALAVGQHDEGEVAMQQARGGEHDAVEHRLGVGRRLTDDAQDFRGRGLAFERMLDVARARLHLFEETCVLDRYDRLIGERLHLRDVGRREGGGCDARHGEQADHFAAIGERHKTHAAIAACAGDLADARIRR